MKKIIAWVLIGLVVTWWGYSLVGWCFDGRWIDAIICIGCGVVWAAFIYLLIWLLSDIKIEKE